MNEETLHRIGRATKFLGRLAGKKAKRALIRMLARYSVPLAVMLGVLLVIFLFVGIVTGAGEDPSMSQDKGLYQGIVGQVNPIDLDEELKLDWGIVKAANVLLADSSATEEELQPLAENLAPLVYRKKYSVQYKVTNSKGEEETREEELDLVHKVVTYNKIYEYDYTFSVEQSGDKVTVVPERQLVGQILDRSRLKTALEAFGNCELDTTIVQVVEQMGISLTTGKSNYSWLGIDDTATEGTVTDWPIVGRITSTFGSRLHLITGMPEDHPGIDIAAESGTPIPAVLRGIVITAGNNGGYGLCVMIDHGNGYVSLYGHCSKILVTKGQHIEQSQVIGEVGNTGVSTGPHLHFEVRLHGEPVSPLVLKP